MQCVAVCCSVLQCVQYIAVCCSVLLCVGYIVSRERVYGAIRIFSTVMHPQSPATLTRAHTHTHRNTVCNTLLHRTATHCNTLQHMSHVITQTGLWRAVSGCCALLTHICALFCAASITQVMCVAVRVAVCVAACVAVCVAVCVAARSSAPPALHR